MLLVKGISGEYLNLSHNTTKTTKVVILERPGLWLGDEALAPMLADIRRIAGLCLGGEVLDYGVFAGDKATLDTCMITLVYDLSGGVQRAVGFNVIRFMDLQGINEGEITTVVHLGLVIVDPEYQGQGVSWPLLGLPLLLYFIRGFFRPVWISNVSQVPSALGRIAETVSNVFPSYHDAPCSFIQLLLARQIMQDHRSVFGVGPEAEFDERRFIIKNSYTGGSDNLKKTFAETQKHRNPKYNAMCENELDYDRGDDFMQLGNYDVRTVWYFIFREIPKAALFQVVIRSSLVFIESLVMPMILWFLVDRAQGNIRPWKEKSSGPHTG